MCMGRRMTSLRDLALDFDPAALFDLPRPAAECRMRRLRSGDRNRGLRRPVALAPASALGSTATAPGRPGGRRPRLVRIEVARAGAQSFLPAEQNADSDSQETQADDRGDNRQQDKE